MLGIRNIKLPKFLKKYLYKYLMEDIMLKEKRKIQRIDEATYVCIPLPIVKIFDIEKGQKVEIIYDDESKKILINPNPSKEE